MKVGDCIKELKIHGLAEEAIGDNGEKQSVLSGKAVCLIEEAWLLMRERYPEATEEDVTIRALIVVVLEKMSLVYRKNLPDYISAIRSLAENGHYEQ